MTIRQEQESHMEDKDYLWILGNQRRTSRIKSLNVSIAIYMDIWQKIAKGHRKRRTTGSAINANE